MSDKGKKLSENDEPGIASVEVENLVRQLPAIQNCRVVIDDWGAIKEIHVLAGNERNAKVIVRDVESALAARFGIMIDHKRISVAQVTTQDLHPSSVRLVLCELSVQRSVMTGKLMVEASIGELNSLDGQQTGRILVGQSEGLDIEGEAERLAVEAVLSAVNPVLIEGYYFAIEEAGSVLLGSYPVMLTLLYLNEPHGGTVLTGSAIVSEDRLMSAAKSCLAALNRRIGLVMQSSRSKPRKKRKEGTEQPSPKMEQANFADEAAPSSEPEHKKN